MRNIMKAATSIGSAALVLSGVAMAAAPTTANFDQWSVSTGTIGAACPTGFTCGTAVTGDGFFQRQIVDTTAGGKTYFQTIITDTGATATQPNLANLTFGDESFVQTQNTAGGILDKQRLKEVSGADTFGGSTSIQSGWAGALVNLGQSLKNTSGSGFRTDFFYEADTANLTAGVPNNMKMKVASRVGLTGTAALGTDQIWQAAPTGIDWQEFLLAEAKGTYISANGTLNLAGATPATSITYTTGNDIKGVYVGQNMNATVGQEFGYQNFDNVSDALALISKFGLTAGSAVGPSGWPAVFGSTATDGTGF
ncbi:MAG: hypothetical protein HY272_13405 [Gammaproteobacteria bacterium]|nr:hypothetical protein [Gammaproteobacteria bacterium]